jgi:NTE family protein
MSSAVALPRPPDLPGRGLGLVMSGGGARAAYQVGVFRTIARRFPGLQPSVMTGVSAGAINAVFLASYAAPFAEAVERLDRLWYSLTTNQVFRVDSPSLAATTFRWMRRLLASAAPGTRNVQGLLDTSPLRRLLESHLVLKRGRIAGIEENIYAGRLDAFGLTTVNYATGHSVTWVQGRGIRSWQGPRRESIRDQIGVEHVMASAALPFFFPAIRIGNAWHGDGGIGLVTPLSPAMYLGAERILAVSTLYEPGPDAMPEPAIEDYPPPAQILGVLMNAIFIDTMDQDARTMRRITRLAEKVPEEKRGGLKPLKLLTVRPSVDLARLAGEYEPELPRAFRYLMRGLGTRETSSPEWLSMLMFEPAYLRRVIMVA